MASDVCGHKLDTFQTECLRVIMDPKCDLLAMAPTGSGKTVIALLAILRAFAKGKRAIYTSPIKTLSNQKYQEFKTWFKEKGVDAEVSLFTGDLRIAVPQGARNELMVRTANGALLGVGAHVCTETMLCLRMCTRGFRV